MNQKKVYRITTKSVGRLTQIPDSQKIFGALIYMYAAKNTNDKTSELVSKIKSGIFNLSLSNMLPEGYFPTPLNYILNKLEEKLPGTRNKEKYKEIKKRLFLPLLQMKEAIKNPDNAFTLYPYACIHTSQQTHASMDSQRYGLPGLDNSTYSIPEITIVTYTGDKNTHKKVSNFNFYISMDDGEECRELKTLMDRAIEERKYFFRGARASQGFNTFTIEEIEEVTVNDQKDQFYLNLGMLLPKEIDYQQSTLKLFTSERRPYQATGGWGKELEDRFISYIEAGSIIHPLNASRDTGRSIQSPFNGRDIVFGNAFLYPVEIGEEVGNGKYQKV